MPILASRRNRAENLGKGAGVDSRRLPRGNIAGVGDIRFINAIRGDGAYAGFAEATGKFVVALLESNLHVIAQTEIDRQAMRDLPVILEIQIPDRLVIKQGIVPIHVAASARRSWQTEQEVRPSRAIGRVGAAAGRAWREA